MEDDKYQMKDFTYYSRIVMMIVSAVQLILFVAIVVVSDIIKDDMGKVNEVFEKDYRRAHYKEIDFDFIFSEQKSGIDACFAFFFIAFVVFLVEFIMHFACEDCHYKYEWTEKFFRKWNHLITILTFVIMQFLYVVCCLIIPIYLDRTRTLRDDMKDEFGKRTYTNYRTGEEEAVDFSKELDDVDSCVNKYAGCFVFSLLFLLISIFLYFIILNLYKGVCCDMIEICRQTNSCFESFFNCFFDNVNYLFNCCESLDPNINKTVRDIEENRKKIAEITCKIQNEMKKNIELRVKNVDCL